MYYRLTAMQKSGMYEVYGSSKYSTQETHGIFLISTCKTTAVFLHIGLNFRTIVIVASSLSTVLVY